MSDERKNMGVVFANTELEHELNFHRDLTAEEALDTYEAVREKFGQGAAALVMVLHDVHSEHPPEDVRKGFEQLRELSKLARVKDRGVSYGLGFIDGLMWLVVHHPTLLRGFDFHRSHELALKASDEFETHGGDPGKWDKVGPDFIEKLQLEET